MKKNKRIAKNEFRYNYKTKHPTYIFQEENGKYKAFGLTHKEKTFNKKNMPLKVNPNKRDKQKAYIRNGVISSKKKNYSKKTLNYQFEANDFKFVKGKVRNYKKRHKKR